MGDRIWHLARGLDARAASTRRASRRASATKRPSTHDIDDAAVLRSELRRLADRVGGRLRAHGWVASTISIKLRFADFTTLSRSQTLPEPTSVGQRIGDAAIDLFESVERPLPVRLVGVRGEKLRPARDEILTLWDDDAEWKRVEGALDDAAATVRQGLRDAGDAARPGPRRKRAPVASPAADGGVTADRAAPPVNGVISAWAGCRSGG